MQSKYFFNKTIDTIIAYAFILLIASLFVSFIIHNDAQVNALLLK